MYMYIHVYVYIYVYICISRICMYKYIFMYIYIGTFDMKFGEYEWIHKRKITDPNRKKHYL